MITSASNEKVKKIAAYNAKNKLRKEDKVFIVEGIRMQVEIPSELILETYVSESFLSKASEKDREYLDSLPLGYEEVSDQVFKKMSDTKAPQGILSLVRQLEYKDEDLFAPAKNRDGSSTGQAPMILILEGIQDPGNLGTIFRSAEGAGVTGIYMSSDCADVYNSKVVRSTMGAIFRMPVLELSLEKVKPLLTAHSLPLYGAALTPTAKDLRTVPLRPAAVAVGSEGQGLSRALLDLCDGEIIIPMRPESESLNAAVAASVVMWEMARSEVAPHE